MTATARDELIQPDFHVDPHAAYSRMRADGPVQKVALSPDASIWLVTRYDQGRQALNDPRLGRPARSAHRGSTAYRTSSWLRCATTCCPPDHTRLRKLVAAAFTHRRVQGLRPRIQEITDSLLDTMAGTDSVDLIDTLAMPLATQVIFELLGVKVVDRERFLQLNNQVTSGSILGAELAPLVAEYIGFIHELIEEKRNQPGDDLLSAMIAVRDEGDRLSDDELTATMFLLLIAGQFTTVHLIGNATYLLLTERSRWEALRADPSRLPQAIDEFLRYEPPVQITGPRMTTEPVDFDGTVIPAGEALVVGLLPCNRDEARFADADALDLTRSDNPHLAFGHGVHYCLGAPLGKLEAEIALGSLMNRFPDLHLDVAESGEAVTWLPTYAVRGPAQLRVTGTRGDAAQAQG